MNRPKGFNARLNSEISNSIKPMVGVIAAYESFGEPNAKVIRVSNIALFEKA